MAPKYPIPRPGSPVSEGGNVATREWYNYWQNLEQNSGGPSTAELENDITIISEKLGSPDGTPENIPPQEDGGKVIGLNSILSIGALPGVVTLTLQGDSADPGNTYYYGTGPSGSKGFYTVASAFLGTAGNIDLSVGTDGVTTIDLAPITQTSGGTLKAITLDGFGRVTQSKAATITGTTNRVTVTNGDASAGLPTIDIASNYAGQTSITTLGTVTTGTWNASVIGVTYGGTGSNLSATGGAGQYLKQSSAGAAITVGTIPAADIVSGQALTATPDTNVTITLGGTPSTALLKASSITLGWAGTLSIARGGTGQATQQAAFDALSPATTSGDLIIYSGGHNIRLGVGSTGQVLGISGGLPAWVAAGGTGTVTSVGLSAPAQFNVTNSPIISSGTIGLSWVNQNANLVLAGPASGASAAPTFRALAASDIPFPTGDIQGLELKWNSASSISVLGGACSIPSTGKLEVYPSTLTINSISLGASVFGHVYAFDNAGTPAIECVTTAPAAPYIGTARAKTGDTSRRYLGSILTDSGGNIIRFKHNWMTGRIDYTTYINTLPFLVAANGVATVTTSVSCSGVVPITSISASVFTDNSDTAAFVRYGTSEIGTLSGSNYLAYLFPSSMFVSQLQLDSSQALTYQYSSAPAVGAMNIRVVGYIYER